MYSTIMNNTRCINCKGAFKFGILGEPGVNVYSVAGANETRISGFCEICFDSAFEENDDDERDE